MKRTSSTAVYPLIHLKIKKFGDFSPNLCAGLNNSSLSVNVWLAQHWLHEYGALFLKLYCFYALRNILVSLALACLNTLKACHATGEALP